MFDSFNRKIHYLRISVTDRCNQRCEYCMPKNGVKKIRHEDVLSFEEILRFTQKAVEMGIDKVRLTGGEPLVRRDIITLVSMFSQIEGIKDFAMTTNGTLLDKFADALINAGLHRVNISLDTLTPARYSEITKGGDIRSVLEGIKAAEKAGLSPIKINCVVQRSSDEEDARQVAAFAKREGFDVRFIRQMNMEKGLFWQVEGGTGGDCERCNRLRLSSDGKLFPCLLSNLAFPIRELGAEEAIRQAIKVKPVSGLRSNHNGLSSIGG